MDPLIGRRAARTITRRLISLSFTTLTFFSRFRFFHSEQDITKSANIAKRAQYILPHPCNEFCLITQKMTGCKVGLMQPENDHDHS